MYIERHAILNAVVWHAGNSTTCKIASKTKQLKLSNVHYECYEVLQSHFILYGIIHFNLISIFFTNEI